MRNFIQIGDSFIAIEEIESINGTSVHARTLGKRAVSINTKSGRNYNGELTPSEIQQVLEFVTGASWNVQ